MSIKLGKTSVSSLSVIVFLLAMYSIGTISAIRVSWTFTITLMVLSATLLMLSNSSNRGIRVNGQVVCWFILTFLCLIGVLRGSSSTLLIFYMLCLIQIASSSSLDINSLFKNLKLIRLFGLIFAFGCYWQYLFPNQYYAKLYPLFGSAYQQSIRRQFTFHKMCTGFTSQTAVAAQFIILGIMAVLYLYYQNSRVKSKLISIIEIVFLSGGLLLTGKRSPILNLAVAIIVVDMLTVRRSKKGNRILAIVLGIVVGLIAVYFLAPLFAGSRNSIVRLLEFTTIEDIGEASNGRLSLYSNAFYEFSKSPVFGIGWGKYGRIYDITGVHNIYLQLLCECGLVGFLLSLGAMFFVLRKTIRMLKKVIEVNNNPVGIILKCSVFIQVYILVYGMFGNPLYDQNYLLMYCMGIIMATVGEFNRLNDFPELN